jgi:hypothetical protein
MKTRTLGKGGQPELAVSSPLPETTTTASYDHGKSNDDDISLQIHHTERLHTTHTLGVPCTLTDIFEESYFRIICVQHHFHCRLVLSPYHQITVTYTLSDR